MDLIKHIKGILDHNTYKHCISISFQYVERENKRILIDFTHTSYITQLVVENCSLHKYIYIYKKLKQ